MIRSIQHNKNDVLYEVTPIIRYTNTSFEQLKYLNNNIFHDTTFEWNKEYFNVSMLNNSARTILKNNRE
jgi:hypothetical protein